MTAAALDRDPLLLAEGTRPRAHRAAQDRARPRSRRPCGRARESMREQGVHHAGPYRNPVSAARAVTGQATSYSDTPPADAATGARWYARSERRARAPRSSSAASSSPMRTTAAIRRIADDLDAARLHIAVTLRPLARIIPSMWQQNVQAGQRAVARALAARPVPGAAGDIDHARSGSSTGTTS